MCLISTPSSNNNNNNDNNNREGIDGTSSPPLVSPSAQGGISVSPPGGTNPVTHSPALLQTMRWFRLAIFAIGVACAVAGAVVAGAKTNPTLAGIMAGIGVLLLTVSLLAWAMTSSSGGGSSSASPFASNSSPSSSLLTCANFLPRLTSNTATWFGGQGHGGSGPGAHPPPPHAPPPPHTYFYPLFHPPPHPNLLPPPPPREPPPSYAASMQEYRLRLLLYERSHPLGVGPYLPPPPYYRANRNYFNYAGHAHYAALNAAGQQQPMSLSRPPSYRSRASNNDLIEEVSSSVQCPPTTPPVVVASSSATSTTTMSTMTSPGATLGSGGGVVSHTNTPLTTVVTVLHTEDTSAELHQGGTVSSPVDVTEGELMVTELPPGEIEPAAENKITIVQTHESSIQTVNSRNSVIVTVSNNLRGCAGHFRQLSKGSEGKGSAGAREWTPSSRTKRALDMGPTHGEPEPNSTPGEPNNATATAAITSGVQILAHL